MKTTFSPPASAHPLAPAIVASEWLNAPQSTSLDALRGRVVVLHFFQMLCPGCAAHGIPQAVEIQRAFDAKKMAVIGVHSVFEHHEVMTPDALRVFVHEYRLTFPIAIDQPAGGTPGIPQTMRDYGLQGTPTLVLIDAEGRIRAHHFGHVSDLQIGSEIGQLLAEAGK